MIFDSRSISCRTALGVLTLSITTAVLTGCGAVSGNPVPGEIDIRKLSVGTYPIEPLDSRFSYSHTISGGLELATGRIDDAVVSGPDVDPSITHGVLSVNLQIPEGLGLVLSSVAKPVAESNNMLFGSSASASTKPLSNVRAANIGEVYAPFGPYTPDPSATSFNVTVLQFPDEQRAGAAAEQMEAADFNVAADQNQRVTIDSHPDAKAHWRPGIPSMGTTIAHGHYVVSIFVQQPNPELAGLKSLTEKILAVQLPLLEKLKPLSRRDMLRLDYDPQGMMRRTLHPEKGALPHSESEITRTPRGFLHNVDDQSTWKKLLEDNGVDSTATALDGGLLLRARDSNAATALWTGITSATTAPADKQADVPDTVCTETSNTVKPYRFDQEDAWDHSDRFICTLHYDRYVARVAGTQLADVTQRAAAQYALLVNSQYM
ncbi:hypothetical protein [Nocardia sp. NBC_00511]|uniref:DUF7373 family lipoprotein n=1 Tax=Nocardia sp. NBC_00511 TaxID=2903591 RepID=UPI0030E3229F